MSKQKIDYVDGVLYINSERVDGDINDYWVEPAVYKEQKAWEHKVIIDFDSLFKNDTVIQYKGKERKINFDKLEELLE